MSTKLMPIGVFAKRCGLTASALRFYDDAGLLPPQRVDPVTGYRYYGDQQLRQATLLRQLRELGMPLPDVEATLTAGPERAARLIDEQVTKVVADAAAVERAATALKAALGERPGVPVCALPGPILADAVDQVFASAVDDPALPTLGGVRVEADPDALRLTATDRYRLATRTLVPAVSSVVSWAGTLAGDQLRALTSQLRRSARVRVEAGADRLRFRMADGAVCDCRLLDEVFPEYRLMLGSLAAVTHRATVGRSQLAKALAAHAAERVGLRTGGNGPRLVVGQGPERFEVALPGETTGGELLVWFELTTLYPAVSQAIGPDVMFDLRGSDQPITIRSADDGDLTILVMPVAGTEAPQHNGRD